MLTPNIPVTQRFSETQALSSHDLVRPRTGGIVIFVVRSKTRSFSYVTTVCWSFFTRPNKRNNTIIFHVMDAPRLVAHVFFPPFVGGENVTVA